MSTSQQKPAESNEEEQTLEYHCPHCDISYEHEFLARAHVTRSEDTAHINRKGFMPETDITITDEDGNVVGTGSDEPDKIDVTELTLDDISDDYSDQHKCIILAGAYNDTVDNYTALESAAQDILEEHGEDVPSYSTIRRVLRNFYRPQEVEAEKQQKAEESEDESEEKLGDLTPKQQAIIIAKLANPDEGDSKLSDRAGDVATSYPRQVYADRAPHVYNRLNEQVESGADVAEAVLQELDVEDVDELNKRGFDLGINLTETIIEASEKNDNDVFDLGIGEQRQAMSASPYDTSEAETEPTETWGAEAETTATEEDTSSETEPELDEVQQTTDTLDSVQEQPDETESTEQTDVTASEPEVEEPVEEPATSTEEQVEAVEEVSSGAGIPREDVEELQQKVSWFVEIRQSESENGSRDAQLAFAEQVEGELEELLQ